MNEWNEMDAVPLREYLGTPSGQKLLYLLEREDAKGTTFETVALNSRYQDGIDYARRLIKSCSVFTRRKSVESTPVIDWNAR